jgi:hypothetical protein
MTKMVNIMDTSDRSYLNFEAKVRKAFAFLGNLGFSEVEALPTLVRYRTNGVEVDVYHGRQSYEIGAGVTAFGTRYAISEIVRAIDPEAAKQVHYATATTPEGVAAGLEELSSLMEHYGRAALRGDSQFFSMLEKQRKCWAEEYDLDVLAEQLRPQADEAFRRKDYSTAVELYSRIRQRLSPAELKKLSFAEKHRQG